MKYTMQITLKKSVGWARYRLVKTEPLCFETLFHHVLMSVRASRPEPTDGHGSWGIRVGELDDFIFMANCHNCEVIVV